MIEKSLMNKSWKKLFKASLDHFIEIEKSYSYEMVYDKKRLTIEQKIIFFIIFKRSRLAVQKLKLVNDDWKKCCCTKVERKGQNCLKLA